MQPAIRPTDKATVPMSGTTCDDCGLPALFRAEVSDLSRGRKVRVYQCQNCAKVIWAD